MTWDQNLIEQYLQNQLSPADKERFEEAMRTDSVLRSEVDTYRDMLDDIQHGSYLDMKNALKEVHQTMTAQRSPSISSKRWLWIIMAIVLVLVGLYVVRAAFSKPTPNRLYAEHYSDYTYHYSQRNDDAEDRSLKLGLAAYNTGEYDRAESHLTDYLKNNDDTNAQILLGCALMQNNKWEQATTLLSDIAASDHPVFSTPAIWYLALISIQTQQPEQAIRWLKKLSTKGEPWSGKARSLLDTLE